jgi:membrane-bound metal-dependent hydrolase YbcI (DUF457 family)
LPLAVTHVILTIIAIDLYRDYFAKNKKFLSLHLILIGGIAGLLPDIDIPLGWILNLFGINIVHGSITHTLWFAVLFFIPCLLFYAKGNKKNALLYLVIGLGVFSHIFLDWLLGGGMHYGVMWFFPFSMQTYKIHLLNNLGSLGLNAWQQGIDALILLAWLWHEEVKHKIKDFI